MEACRILPRSIGGTGRVHTAASQGLRNPGFWFVFFAALLLGLHKEEEDEDEDASDGENGRCG
jgi:hypothetical protein